MSRPDPKLLPFPARTSGTRDPRIDVLRGLALILIFVDHMPGNPYEYLSYRNIGFSDAAEGFYILSGVADGIAYSTRFLPEQRRANGLWPAIAPVWKRSWTLYLVHLFLTLWAIVIFAGGADLFGRTDFFNLHNLKGVFENPEEVLFGMVTLGHQIGYVNILPVYCALLLFAPAAILLALWRPMILLALSVATWFLAGTFHVNLHNYPNGGVWFFNPLSWQLVFVIGLLAGIALRRGERLVPVSRPLFLLALGWIALSFAWRMIPPLGEALNHAMWWLDQQGLPSIFFTQDKTDLGLPRVLHVLAVFYVISCLPVARRIAAHRVAAPLRLLGRQGLIVFSAGTVLALIGQVLMLGLPEALWPLWLPTPVGIALMLAAAWIADDSRRRSRKTGTTTTAAQRPVALPPRRGLSAR